MDEELPYAGLQVLDASQGIAGPHCGMLLAQHGADVIKMEPPHGDWMRQSGKQYGDQTASSLNFSRGKRSIALDLKTPEGLDLAQALAKRCDVLLENFRPGVMARYGLDYESVRKDNADVVYASTLGFGDRGPESDRPVTDMVMQGYSGWMHMNRDRGGTPHRADMPAIDVMTGLYGFQAVSAALYRHARTGKGAHVEVNMMEAAGAFQAAKIIESHLEQGVPQPLGAPIGTYPTADGFINLNARQNHKFAGLCEIVGHEEWMDDPRFATPEARVAHGPDLAVALAEVLSTRPTAEWAEGLRSHDIIHTKINTYDDYLSSEQTAAMGTVAWIDHPDIGRLPMHNIPGTPRLHQGDLAATAPHIGEHTREICRTLDLDDAAIDALRDNGAIEIYGEDMHTD
ncbi:MAG: CoA transferase [Alphaproteobacteria bacterium]|nr:CoA transferase [Alphaproteobacteria bacterium]